MFILDKGSEADGIDLNCREHVSDSETDSTPEDDIIENKAFPQQRFSPVMKHINSSDITYRPKPIKRIPDSGKPGPNSPVGVPPGHQSFDRQIPRPSSNGSNFQPTGAVFKAKGKQSRYLSTGSVQDLRTSLYDHMPNHRGESVSSMRGLNQQQMKIHNITMATGSEQKIIMSSNMETTPGNQNGRGGPIIGKFSQRGPIKQQQPQRQTTPVSTTQSILQQTLQTGAQNTRPVTTTAIHIVPSPQQALLNQQYANKNSVIPTFTTIGKPISASVPSVSLQQNPVHGSFNTSIATANMQPQTILPNASSAGLKNVGGTIVLQGIPASQYGMIIGSQALASPTVTKPPTLSVAGSTQYIGNSLQNYIPLTAGQNQGQATPTQTMAPPTVLTNFIIKPGQGGQTIQPALNSPSPGQPLTPNFNQPTHVQYILPSIRMQAPQPGGKVQNHVIQMALPGTHLPQGSIQLTFAGNQNGTQAQSMQQVQQVKVSPQQVQTGKIQITPGYKVVQSPVKQQPSPAASPQLNTAPQTIQVSTFKYLSEV
jgi:hypothetical protein